VQGAVVKLRRSLRTRRCKGDVRAGVSLLPTLRRPRQATGGRTLIGRDGNESEMRAFPKEKEQGLCWWGATAMQGG
jgi:hypothetical protein